MKTTTIVIVFFIGYLSFPLSFWVSAKLGAGSFAVGDYKINN